FAPPDGRTDQRVRTDGRLVPKKDLDAFRLEFSLDDHGIRGILKTPQSIKFLFHGMSNCFNSPKIREISPGSLWACRQKRNRSLPWATVGDKMGRTSKPWACNLEATSLALPLPGTRAHCMAEVLGTKDPESPKSTTSCPKAAILSKSFGSLSPADSPKWP